MKKFLAIVLAIAMMATMAVSFAAFEQTEDEPTFEDVSVVEKVVLGNTDNTSIKEALSFASEDDERFFNVYAGTSESVEFVIPTTITKKGLTSLGLKLAAQTNSETPYKDFIAALGTDDVNITVVQTSGQGIATVTGTWDYKTCTLKISVVSNPFAAYVDMRQVNYNIVATYASDAAYNNTQANGVLGFLTAGESVTLSGSYTAIILPNYFEKVAGNLVTGVTFSQGTTWGQLQTVAYSEALKGAKVSFQVMDMATFQGVNAGTLATPVTVTFDKFALTEAVNFVYKTAYTDADYENVLAVVDFQAAGRIFNDVGYVTLNNVGALGAFSFTGYNTGDLFNVYFDGQLIEEGIALNYDAKTGVSSISFKLYNPTSTTSMLGKYVVAKAPVVVEEEPTANPEMGADSMINVAVALAAVSLAAAGFVAVKKSK